MIPKIILTAAIGLACGLLTGCDEPCVPAEMVRVKINETVYRLPASFQPYIHLHDKEFPTRDKIQNGLRIQEYCQKPEDPPVAVESFGFGKRSLDKIASERPEFSRLRGMELLVIRYAPASRLPVDNQSGSLVSAGSFRRIEKNGTFDLFSTEPLLFGSRISAFCGPAATHKSSNWCTVQGLIAPGIPIRVRFNDSTHPIDEWPRTLEEVERLIRSFATP